MLKIKYMKRMILLFLLALFSTFSYSQIQTKKIENKGVFNEISVKKQNQAIENTQSINRKTSLSMIEIIKENPNDYNPPVL